MNAELMDLQLVGELGVAQDKTSVGYYVGLVVCPPFPHSRYTIDIYIQESLFFLTEAIFILQWGRLSDRIGRKPVLAIGLLGLAISMISFGLSHSLLSVIGSRALAGALNGNVGVLKSAIGELTDESNMARAFSFIPLVWFVGSTVALVPTPRCPSAPDIQTVHCSGAIYPTQLRRFPLYSVIRSGKQIRIFYHAGQRPHLPSHVVS